jgi:hypothetical protein
VTLQPKPPNLTQNLHRAISEVNELFGAQGRPVPVPPDVEPDMAKANRDKGDFFAEIDKRLAPEERAWLR